MTLDSIRNSCDVFRVSSSHWSYTYPCKMPPNIWNVLAKVLIQCFGIVFSFQIIMRWFELKPSQTFDLVWSGTVRVKFFSAGAEVGKKRNRSKAWNSGELYLRIRSLRIIFQSKSQIRSWRIIFQSKSQSHPSLWTIALKLLYVGLETQHSMNILCTHN